MLMLTAIVGTEYTLKGTPAVGCGETGGFIKLRRRKRSQKPGKPPAAAMLHAPTSWATARVWANGGAALSCATSPSFVGGKGGESER